MSERARKKKICSDPKCRQKWEELEEMCGGKVSDFLYCPFCAEELNVHCSACQETVSDGYFRFCPWCGREFEQ
ncbi:MAG: hypothetical protein JRJ59_05190 [Deltaproteobacteria bacterium]|nr:hypothetical protein [Deltaproteobacteria bacterium]